MTPSQDTAILDALTQAVRAGFRVTFEPAATGGFSVTIKPVAVVAGTATDRVEPFTIVRESLRDAAANGLNVIVLEIGADK